MAAFAGAAVNRLLDPRLVLVGFAVLMIAAGVRMLRDDQQEQGGACALPTGGVNWLRCLPRSIPVGFAVGFLTGLFGVGGGFLIIAALVLTLGLPMASAVPTSLIMVGVNSASGVWPTPATAVFVIAKHSSNRRLTRPASKKPAAIIEARQGDGLRHRHLAGG